MQRFQEILQKGEHEQVEFKSSFSDDVIISLTAFANTHGGSVYIGVQDNGTITGVTLGKETIISWLTHIKNKTQPAIIPHVREFEYNGCAIVELHVVEYPVKPIAFKNRFYKRVQNSNHALSALEISHISMESLQLSWDAYPALGKTFDDLDIHKIERFLQRVQERGRFNLQGTPIECLQKIKLLQHMQPTHAAYLLFAKETIDYNIHIGRFKTPSLIIDDKLINFSLFEMTEEAMRFIFSHLKVAFEITGKTTSRNEIMEYPIPAIRELLLNAIIHRDYMNTYDIQIKIFDSSIRFYNLGGLYG
nr:putative DNA binding domain-containing protein [Bacteroidales bacterium]